MSYDFYQRIWDRAQESIAAGIREREALREAFLTELDFCRRMWPSRKLDRLFRDVKKLLYELGKEK